MSAKKYELVPEDTVTTPDGRTLFRIRALVAIAALGVSPGDLGGYIEAEKNLTQVSGNAQVSGNVWVYGNAWVYDNAQVYGDARVSGNAWVSRDAWVYGDARVSRDARVYGDAQVYGRNHLGWFSCVGSGNGTLCWFLQKDRAIHVTRGCFSGSLEDFSAAVEKTHGDSPNGQQYRLLIQFIELRAAEALKDYAPVDAPVEEAA